MNDTQFSLKDRVALITGAGGHLGQAMAAGLARAGAMVYINSRSQQRAAEQVGELQSKGFKAQPAVFDVLDTQQVNGFFRGLTGPLHVLVNNAYAGGAGNIALSQDEQYQRAYDVTVTAAHRMLQAALPALKTAVAEHQDASVINLGSMYGMVTPDPNIYATPEEQNPPFYGAAKAALLHWTRYAAREFAVEGIRVNALSPGPFPAAQVLAQKPEFVASLVQRVPLGRVGHPDDLLGPLLLLASSASRFMTGTNLTVDGGWTSL